MKVRAYNSSLSQDTEKGLRRTKPLKAKRKKKVFADRGFQGEAHGMPCLLCDKLGCHGHHFLPQQLIRAYARTHKLSDARLRELLSDRRNRGELCPDCHANEENGNRVPLEKVPASAFEFAGELGLDWVLERRYGRRAAA